MKLYCTPGGQWFSVQGDWAKAAKAEGHDATAIAAKCAFDIPVDKKGLLEFLTFHHVNLVYPVTTVPITPEAPTEPAAQVVDRPIPADSQAIPAQALLTLDALFAAAPLTQRLDLAELALSEANTRLRTAPQHLVS